MNRILKFSNFDVYTIVRELDSMLSRGTILNIYEIEDLLILKVKTKNNEKKNLIIKNDSRINLTNYNYPIPKYPSQYVMSLRKFMKNKKVLSISQHNFDRIIIFNLSDYDEEPWKFIVELFNKGNYILVDDKDIVKIANKYRKFKDRDILANREYKFPKPRGRDFLTLNREEFDNLIINSDQEIVRILARNINISGLYSEELCYKAGIEKTEKGNNLGKEDLKNLFDAFKTLRNQLLFGEIRANIIIDENENQISVQPFDLFLYQNYNKKYFESFNEAVDYYYSQIDSDLVKSSHNNNLDHQINIQEQILIRQKEYLNELKHQKKNFYDFGDFIYANFNTLEKLLDTISNARNRSYSIEEINEKLLNAKNDNIEGLEFFIKIVPSTKQVIININDNEVYLNLNTSLGENANRLYTKGKKIEKKIKGTISAIEKTKRIIQQLINKREEIEEKVDILIKKPKKKWFEKFRWFFSSEGFLIIGGRDASSNELIYKKYIDDKDLVFHTNFPGSPLTVVKNPEGKEIPQKTIKEAAIFVASYSRAWKENWGVVDVFFVLPDQVSKTPPSGEFLPRGSFMISGKKSLIKDVETELAIGLELIELNDSSNEEIHQFYPKIKVGPETAIKSEITNVLIIKPSNTGLQKGALAKEIISYFLKTSEKKFRKWIKLLTLDDMILILPSGKSIIKND
ncbi:MAG: ribosome rescue protein RqcH [Candidatus Hermodarchaeota archaeon]